MIMNIQNINFSISNCITIMIGIYSVNAILEYKKRINQYYIYQLEYLLDKLDESNNRYKNLEIEVNEKIQEMNH